MAEVSHNQIQYRIELFLALAVTGLASAAGLSDLLFAPNHLYPAAYDFMGHMAKIRFLAESLSQGEIPSWFPDWYNGTSVSQYYSPLSYWFCVPFFLITQNVMLTFKAFCFCMIYSGGMGVWFFCRKYIGRWCGLFGIIAFCFQPYILLTLLREGQIAQGPIIAILPWYILVLLAYCRNPVSRNFILCIASCLLMILSHANTAFMIFLCVMISLTAFLFLRSITFQTYFFIALSFIFAGVISAFWSLVGTTGLENPGLPYVSAESAELAAAKINWFISKTGPVYFALSTTAGSIAAFIVFLYHASIRKLQHSERYYVLFSIILVAVSFAFSFGLKMPLFRYLPMSETFFAGRILNLTSVCTAILCAYLIYAIAGMSIGKQAGLKVFAALICILIMTGIVININPFQIKYGFQSDDAFNKLISKVDVDEEKFNKGRYDYHTSSLGRPSDSYFPLSYHFNISGGADREGTPHIRTIWNEDTAVQSENFDYVAKNYSFWNIRYFLTGKQFERDMQRLITKYSFTHVGDLNDNSFFVSNVPSSYFLVDYRNALVFGIGAPGLAIEFPFLVHEERNRITDYSYEELAKYDVIYLCEPEINTIQDKQSMESIITRLVNDGKTVMIEPAISKGYSLFNVVAADILLENAPEIMKQDDSEIAGTAASIMVDKKVVYARALFGLDKVYYRLDQNNGRLKNDIIGTVHTGKGEVLFIGLHLSQYLKAAYARIWGLPDSENGYPRCSDEVKTLFEDIFSIYGVNKDFWPEPFPVIKAEWNYKGVDFVYSSPNPRQITVSVTYTPRWRATLDGNPIPVGQRENLITLDLPAGEHEVKLVYGLTKYGIAGYIISAVGLILLVLFLKFYDIIVYHFRHFCIKIGKYLQLDHLDRNE